ncbi:MAG: biotin/lipoyl-containing protein [Deltaproteobacteria bacterium]
MKYFVEVAGREHEVMIKPLPDGTLSVDVGGRTVKVEAMPFGPRELLVRVGERVVDLTVEGVPPQLGIVASGHRTYVKVESERMRAANRAAGPVGGGKERDVRSPMPGRVVKVLVAVGDTVGPGQSVIIVEAMKMENEVRAKKGGVVTRVHFAAGATVEGNAVLVTFEA